MSKRILVVEDQEDNRQIIRDMLSATDYQITEAENGQEALAVVAKQRPDLILMDIQMPVLDGYEANCSAGRGRSRSTRCGWDTGALAG
jgi:two-component system cell cycle response regulator DivK